MAQRKGFLTVYEYRMGAVWAYVIADSKEQIEREFPQLDFADELPQQWADEAKASVLTVDISDREDPYLKGLRGARDAT